MSLSKTRDFKNCFKEENFCEAIQHEAALSLGEIVQKQSCGPLHYLTFGSGDPLLIYSGIHGDEELAIISTLQAMRHIIRVKKYTRRSIYYIPVLIPDSYKLQSRTWNGVDPNRDWNYDNNLYIYYLKKLVQKTKFKDIISVHCYPWLEGDNDSYNNFLIYSQYDNSHNIGEKFGIWRSDKTNENHSGNEVDWMYCHSGSCASVMAVDFSTKYCLREATINLYRLLKHYLIKD